MARAADEDLTNFGQQKGFLARRDSSTMPSGYTPSGSMSDADVTKPEERELASKLKELGALEGQLADQETELATMQANLHKFERASKAVLDPRYNELAELRQKIAELIPRARPIDPNAKPAEPKPSTEPPKRRNPRPPRTAPRPRPEVTEADQLKRLYREVAKAIHPDLADDDVEREQRHKLMARANEAYEASDRRTLELILHEWEASPEAVRGDGPIFELVRAIRKIHRCQRRMIQIQEEVVRISGSGLFGLKQMAEAADSYERDLLDEMAGRLDADIMAARAQLASLQSRVRPMNGEPHEPEPEPAAESEVTSPTA